MKGHRERSPGHWAIVIDVRDLTTGKRRRRWHSFAGNQVVRGGCSGRQCGHRRFDNTTGRNIVNARAAGMFPIGVAGIPVTAVPGGGG
jgi:hypothetical protein